VRKELVMPKKIFIPEQFLARSTSRTMKKIDAAAILSSSRIRSSL
jgi:hypothetical protein